MIYFFLQAQAPSNYKRFHSKMCNQKKISYPFGGIHGCT